MQSFNITLLGARLGLGPGLRQVPEAWVANKETLTLTATPEYENNVASVESNPLCVKASFLIKELSLGLGSFYLLLKAVDRLAEVALAVVLVPTHREAWVANKETLTLTATPEYENNVAIAESNPLCVEASFLIKELSLGLGSLCLLLKAVDRLAEVALAVVLVPTRRQARDAVPCAEGQRHDVEAAELLVPREAEVLSLEQ